MEYLGIGLIQALMTVFVTIMVLYFCFDVIYLARQNDRLRKRLGSLEQRVKKIEK